MGKIWFSRVNLWKNSHVSPSFCCCNSIAWLVPAMTLQGLYSLSGRTFYHKISQNSVEIINSRYGANWDQPSRIIKMLFQTSIYYIHVVATQNNNELCWIIVLTKTDFSPKCDFLIIIPDSKVHGANMGPHVGPLNFIIWDCLCLWLVNICILDQWPYWVHYHLRRTCGYGGILHPLLKPISYWLPYFN